MSEHPRASVHIVEPGQEPPVAAPAPEPTSELPAGPPPPPQELEKDLGGPLPTGPSPQDLAAAAGGGLAGEMQAAFRSMSATEEFTVPGWVDADGNPQLILVARTFGDRKSFNEGLANEVFIAKSTHKLLWVDANKERHEIPGGWGKGLAELLGIQVSKAADLVSMVISKPDPNDSSQRIPNVAGIGTLATQIINWAGAGLRQAEEDLGE